MFLQIKRRDDSYNRAQEVYGALRAALTLAGTLGGVDREQDATLKDCTGHIIDAITAVYEYGEQRKRMQEKT